uniref:Uncharacterized protein n=1 Tax=Magallana gigas TaxID=29159 RepID=A0A8W8MER9_MAGGI|nr:uncharacterized protein LOC117683497 [Crassostrea gigas]
MLSTSFDTHKATAKERTSTERSSLISPSTTKPTTILSTTKTFTNITETTLPSQNTILSSPTSNFFLEYKTVLVVVGLCIVELTLIIVGVLAVVKHKRRRTYNTALRQTDRNDGRLHTRQNSYMSANVYDEIELHGNDELIDDKNPYEELPEGEYDKIFQPRPHVNKGDLQE